MPIIGKAKRPPRGPSVSTNVYGSVNRPVSVPELGRIQIDPNLSFSH